MSPHDIQNLHFAGAYNRQSKKKASRKLDEVASKREIMPKMLPEKTKKADEVTFAGFSGVY